MPARPDAAELRRRLLDLPGWSVVRGALRGSVEAPSFAAAAALVAAVARLAEQLDHHPDVDLRRTRVAFTCTTRSVGAVTDRDLALAARISAAAEAAGARMSPRVPTVVEIAIDATDATALLPFWRAGLGYAAPTKPGGQSPDLVDPAGRGPAVWFQPMEVPRTQRSRTHVDVYLPEPAARGRVEEVLRAGGRLLTREHAPAWWVLADAEGNELCLCTDEPDPAGA